MFVNAFRQIFENKINEKDKEKNVKECTSPEMEEEHVLKKKGEENEQENENNQATDVEDVSNEEENNEDNEMDIQERPGGNVWNIGVQMAIRERPEFHPTCLSSGTPVKNSSSALVPSNRVRKAKEHNQQVKDRLDSKERLEEEKKEFQRLHIQQKLYAAEKRRRKVLEGKPKLGRINCGIIDTKSNHEIDVSLRNATISREKLIAHTQEKAHNEVEYARSLASEKCQFDKEYALVRKTEYDEKLLAAALRQRAVIEVASERRQQHFEYVNKVIQTKKEKKDLTVKRFTERLENAQHRRQNKLHAIRAEAGKHNLMIQKKLERSKEVEKEIAKEKTLLLNDKLVLAAKRRHETFANKKCSKPCESQNDVAERKKAHEKKLEEATTRRAQFLERRTLQIQERSANLRLLKHTKHQRQLRSLANASMEKMKQAEVRRLSFIESRRRKCAVKNLRVKMASHRSMEETLTLCQQNKKAIADKLSLAAERRKMMTEPAFAMLVSKRAQAAMKNRIKVA